MLRRYTSVRRYYTYLIHVATMRRTRGYTGRVQLVESCRIEAVRGRALLNTVSAKRESN
jgi:hypothetical protein